MKQKDYEQEFDRLAVDNPIVHAALLFHETARSRVDLVMAMKVMVVELARENERLAKLALEAIEHRPMVIRLCDIGPCSSEVETPPSNS